MIMVTLYLSSYNSHTIMMVITLFILINIINQKTNNVAKKRGILIVSILDDRGIIRKSTLDNAPYVPSYPQNIFSVQLKMVLMLILLQIPVNYKDGIRYLELFATYKVI